MKREGINSERRFFILKTLIRELGIIIGLASIFLLLKDGAFIICCYKSACLMSLAFICHLGIEVFSSLDDHRWRIKLANEDYPIVKALILILLNTLTFLLSAPSKKVYPFLFIPLLLWSMFVLFNQIGRYFKR